METGVKLCVRVSQPQSREAKIQTSTLCSNCTYGHTALSDLLRGRNSYTGMTLRRLPPALLLRAAENQLQWEVREGQRGS